MGLNMVSSFVELNLILLTRMRIRNPIRADDSRNLAHGVWTAHTERSSRCHVDFSVYRTICAADTDGV